jgi:drug/metabolite transporter (DMT)-like permease
MKHNLFLGVILALIATMFYSALTAINKAYAASLPLPVIVFMQSFISFLFFIPIIMKKGLPHLKKIMKTSQYPTHIMRAIMSLTASYLLFASVKYIPLTNAMLLAMSTPLIIPFVAYFFFSQKINHDMWIPILVGFAGIALVLHPDARMLNVASLLALGTAICFAFTILFVRKLSKADSVETITFYFILFSTLISGVIAIKFWITLTPMLWLVLLITGGFYFFSQYTMTYSLRYINSQLVSTLLYANVLNSALISLIFWHTIPTELTLFGMLLTVVGGILCIRAEHVRHKRVQTQELEYAKD